MKQFSLTTSLLQLTGMHFKENYYWNTFQRKYVALLMVSWTGRENTTRIDALFRNYVEENANIEIAQLLRSFSLSPHLYAIFKNFLFFCGTNHEVKKSLRAGNSGTHLRISRKGRNAPDCV